MALFIGIGVYLLGWILYLVLYVLPMLLYERYGVVLGGAIYLAITISTVLTVAVSERMGKDNE